MNDFPREYPDDLIEGLKSQLKEARETRRIENEGWEEKANHCFKNHISQIVSLETKLELARGALEAIAQDGKVHLGAGGYIKCIPSEPCSCAEEYAKKALDEIA